MLSRLLMNDEIYLISDLMTICGYNMNNQCQMKLILR